MSREALWIQCAPYIIAEDPQRVAETGEPLVDENECSDPHRLGTAIVEAYALVSDHSLPHAIVPKRCTRAVGVAQAELL
ncbi:hypothetical protein NDU88_003066 [Pleurodeles waltl]|uniref:Uncharacterized protein n=1 Tax=Pleurodeles waltl TaxID=8319 RepID=A0AAV7WRA7_PLEWA|nr:hypothetical protein NDU88_003066 [Pleurodeles waltl]